MGTSRRTVAVATLMTLAFGGLFVFSLLCAAVGTPPFNQRLGWLIAIDHGALRVESGVDWMGEGGGRGHWQPATEPVALLPAYAASGPGAGLVVPLWMPVALAACFARVASRRAGIERTERRAKRGAAAGPCPGCEHAMRGIGGDGGDVTCPECGRVARRGNA